MNRNRINWVATSVIVLVLLNIGLLATIWLQQKKTDEVAPLVAGTTARALLTRDLGFDSLQAHRFDTLRQQHHERMQAISREMRTLKDRFFSGLRGDTPASDSLAAAIGRLQGQMDMNTYAHFRLVRALCTPAQQEKFDRIIQNIIRQMGRPEAPLRPGGNGPGPDGPPDGRGFGPPDGPDGPPPGDGPPDRQQ